MRFSRLTTFVLVSVTAGCQGLIADPLDKAPGQAASTLDCATQRGLSESRMRRLTREELVNTLSDLLGDDVVGSDAVKAQLAILPSDEPGVAIGEIAESHADVQFGVMTQVATGIADIVGTSASLRERIFGACANAATVTDDCAKAFITRFGAKIQRQPLATDEVEGLRAFYATKGGVEGLRRVLMRLVLSPTLAFHLENGTEVDGTRVRLSDYEIASRIAYRTTGTLPDAALFDDAAAGRLQDPAAVEEHVRRLLVTPRGQSKLADFFTFYFQIAEIQDPTPAVAAANGIDGMGMGVEAVAELQETLSYLTAHNATVEELFTSRVAFPRSDRLAKVLGSAKAVGDAPAETDVDHSGALLHPALLIQSGQRTNPMRRASTVRKHLLCNIFGSPDPSIVQEATDTLEIDADTVSTRTFYEDLTAGGECLACHTRLNPVGFALEGYDQTGSKRTTEAVFDADDALIASFSVNTHVDNPRIDPDGTVASLEDGLGLATTIAYSETLRDCFATTLYEYRLGRVSAKEDACALTDVTSTGSVLDAFVASVATADIFWKAVER